MAQVQKNSNTDIEKVSLHLISIYGNFKIPIQYFDTIMLYRNNYRKHWKLRVNFKKDVKGKKWPKSFDFYQRR